jgi:ABC-type branched-subunit amino acid transport system ATPase component
MPQDFTVGSDNQQINKQRLESLQKQAKERGEVFPYDIVTVHATKKLVDSASIADIQRVGQAMEVHSAVAEKLIAAGKATKEKPSDEKDATALLRKISLAKDANEAKSLVEANETRDSVKEALKKKLAEFGS